MPHIYSTLTNPQNYCSYSELDGKNAVVQKQRSVHIKGGSGLANKNLQTPLGVMTFVTEDQLKFLQAHRSFNKHVAAGYITVRNEIVNTEKAAADMTTRDESAPIVPEDFKEEDEAKPLDIVKKEKLKKGK